MDEDNFDEELEQLIKDAMDERDEGTDDDGETGDIGEGSGSTEEDDGQDESEEDDTGTSGDGDEDEHQESDEENTTVNFKPIEVDVSGVKVTINSEEEMLAYIRKGASTFTKEPEKFVEEKTILEQGNVSASDLKLLVDAKNGSKEALALLARKANIDILDVESEMADAYTQQAQYHIETDVDKVANEILSNETLATEFRKVSSALPKDFMNEITSNAQDLKAFSGHIESGIAQKIIPLAINSQIVNGGNFMENYNRIGLELSQKKAQPEVKREVGQREQELRKRASSGTGHNNSSNANSGKDIWDMSDEDFNNLDLSRIK
jgi:hypothetical protein